MMKGLIGPGKHFLLYFQCNCVLFSRVNYFKFYFQRVHRKQWKNLWTPILFAILLGESWPYQFFLFFVFWGFFGEVLFNFSFTLSEAFLCKRKHTHILLSFWTNDSVLYTLFCSLYSFIWQNVLEFLHQYINLIYYFKSCIALVYALLNNCFSIHLLHKVYFSKNFCTSIFILMWRYILFHILSWICK